MAMETVKRGLSQAPSNPYAWVRLGYLDLRHNGKDGLAPQAFSMSTLLGPYEKNLILPRLGYNLLLWDNLDSDDQGVVRHQIPLADRVSRKELVVLAKNALAKNDSQILGIILESMAPSSRFEGFVRALSR